jgi:hypothetical protein
VEKCRLVWPAAARFALRLDMDLNETRTLEHAHEFLEIGRQRRLEAVAPVGRLRPLAADRTLIEAWSFRAEGAPELLLERSMNYNRLVFSPMSVVAHDDVHLFESMQKGLRGEGNEWVSLHRDFDPAELGQGTAETNGTNELLMRNQFRAWAKFMGEPGEGA